MFKFRLVVVMLIMAMVSVLSSCKETVKTFPSGQMKVDKKVETAINTDSVYFNSRDLFCKTPFGAVEQGNDITMQFLTKKGDVNNIDLNIRTKFIYDTFAKSVKFKKFKVIAMKKIGTTNNYDMWQAKFKLDKIGVYGYYFELHKNDKDAITFANNSTTVNVPGVKIKGTGGVGKVTRFGKYKTPYNLTIYAKNFIMPAWTDNMVIYYIFPERFKNGNKKNDPKIGKTKYYDDTDIEVHENWNDVYPWVPGNRDGKEDDDKEYCNDFYGGDIDGIIQKLDYIKELGINVLYLNPVFKAPSNHKYDCADFKAIDPSFGTIKTFKKLVAEAKKRGIRIILDTSLNHCGADSVYMDRYGKYPTLGAFENEEIRKDSPYYEWFEFVPKAKKASDKYKKWFVDSLANLNESDGYKDFAFRDKDSVTKYWMAQGADAWRMDVTPWVSDEFWREWYTAIKSSYPDSFTVAEVWFDASKYLCGDMFDSTMNYIFRQAMLDYAKGGKGTKTVNVLEMIRENYPPQVFSRLMNLMSTHDQPRTLWEVGYKKYGQKNYEEKYKKRFLITLAFQFTYPGAPTVYYGDEIGLTGGHDPFNRGPYPWKEDGGDYGDYSILPIVQSLASMRKLHPVFVKGAVKMLYADKNIVSFERSDGKQTAYMIFNNAKEAMTFKLSGISEGKYKSLVDGKTVELKNGEELTIPAYSYEILLK